MSHFGVIVCLPPDTDLAKLEAVLDDVMEPWDETCDVEPYRHYEDGSADGYWWVNSVRRGAEHHRNGTGLDDHRVNDLDFLARAGRRSPEEVEVIKACRVVRLYATDDPAIAVLGSDGPDPLPMGIRFEVDERGFVVLTMPLAARVLNLVEAETVGLALVRAVRRAASNGEPS